MDLGVWPTVFMEPLTRKQKRTRNIECSAIPATWNLPIKGDKRKAVKEAASPHTWFYDRCLQCFHVAPNPKNEIPNLESFKIGFPSI